MVIMLVHNFAIFLTKSKVSEQLPGPTFFSTENTCFSEFLGRLQDWYRNEYGQRRIYVMRF